MGDALYSSSAVVPITTEPLIERLTGDYVTGAVDIKAKIRRGSDGYVLDWGAIGGPTFVDPAGAVVQLLQVLTEFGASFPGEYETSFDATTVTNITAHDTYYITVIQDTSASNVANLPQAGQFRFAPEFDDATLSRKALYNSQTLQPGDTNNLELKDDNGTDTVATWNIKDPAGLAVTVGAGAPAIRERTS